MKASITDDKKERKKLYEKAFAAILKAYSISPFTAYYFQIGQAQEGLGRKDLAKEAYKDFLGKANSSERKELDFMIKQAEQKIKDL